MGKKKLKKEPKIASEDTKSKDKKSIENTIIKSNGGIKVILTKEVRDRDGEIVNVDGVNLDNFRRNPILLWQHRMINGDVEDVMGKIENIEKTSDTAGVPMIVGEPVFASHPKAEFLKGMVEDEIVNTLSIGFRVSDFDSREKVIKESELLEVSFVTVPSNVEAVVAQKGYKGFKDVDEFDSEMFKKLNNYKTIHPKIKNYRKLFLSDEFADTLGYEKTGKETKDIRAIYDLIVKVIESSKEKPEETPEAEDSVKQETPDYATREDVIDILEAIYGVKPE